MANRRAAHKATLKLNRDIPLDKDIEVVVHRNGRKWGTVVLATRSIEWRPEAGKVRHLTWPEFVERMRLEEQD
jgi:hypothetical protein